MDISGESNLCSNQGIYEPGRVLTYQSHPEFDRFVNGECIKSVVGTEWTQEEIMRTLEQVDEDDDSGLFGELVVEFLLQRPPYQS